MSDAKLYYVETSNGATIKKATTEEGARRKVLREVGTLAGVQLVREATERDIAWVRGMGGHVPK